MIRHSVVFSAKRLRYCSAIRVETAFDAIDSW
jgi:hypothetical protein